jgi:hypothetical protein
MEIAVLVIGAYTVLFITGSVLVGKYVKNQSPGALSPTQQYLIYCGLVSNIVIKTGILEKWPPVPSSGNSTYLVVSHI